MLSMSGGMGGMRAYYTLAAILLFWFMITLRLVWCVKTGWERIG